MTTVIGEENDDTVLCNTHHPCFVKGAECNFELHSVSSFSQNKSDMCLLAYRKRLSQGRRQGTCHLCSCYMWLVRTVWMCLA